MFDGILILRNDTAVLDQVQAFVSAEVPRRTHPVTTRVDVLSLTPAAYEGLLTRLPAWKAGTMRLDVKEAEDLVARAARGDDGFALAASAEVSGMSGQRVSVQRLGQQAYVRGYEIVQGGGDSVPDPAIDVANDGFVLDCRATLSENRRSVTLDLIARYAALERPLAVTETEEGGRKAHAPALASATFQATLTAETGGALLAGSAGPFAIDGKERHLVALVRCGAAP